MFMIARRGPNRLDRTDLVAFVFSFTRMQIRFNFLFRSTKGLILVAIAMIALTTAVFGMLSGPMAEFGIRDVVVRLLGIKLVAAEREGRIILLYHSIAMAVVAIETYMITALMKVTARQHAAINATITVGYLCSMIFGLGFAYWGHNWVFHGLFIFGLSLVFFAGCQLALALSPWRSECRINDLDYAHTKSGIDLERAAFFTMTVVTLTSALFGAIPGSFFGNGFEVFLAEDVIREPYKAALDLSIIGHLHIMLALIAIACTLIIGRWMDFKGILHKVAMPLMIVGSFILALGTWLVVPFEEIAHWIIYGGSSLAMLAALFLVIFSWDKLIKEGLAEKSLKKGNFFRKVAALMHDPLKFGATWQMVFMNFNVSFVGIFVAVKLEDIFRVWQYRDERTILTGHWHVLAALTATILLFYYADMAGLKGMARRWFGWLVIIFSDLAFGAATVFELKRLFVDEATQQPLVNDTSMLVDLGLAILLVVIAMLMIWRLADLFKKDGRWKEEMSESLTSPVELE
jgi:hypothetical protein